jgi:heptosyltransferase-2
MMKLISENIQSITVVKLDHIGDVILATPVIKSLRISFPAAMIRVVVGSWSKEVLYNNPNVDEIICYDPPWLDRSLLTRRPEKTEHNRVTMKYLMETKHDLVVDLRRGDFIHTAFSSTLLHKYFLAYKTESQFDQLITHGVSVTDKEHVTDQQIKLLKCLGLKTSKIPELYSSDEDEVWAENQISSVKPKVAIFTGAGAPIKKWPEGKFLSLAHRLHKLGIELVLVGGKEENVFAQKLSKQIKLINLCGKTSLPQLTSVLKRVLLLVSNDSAPVHIASAVGTQVIVITKPNAKVEFAPVGNENTTISRSRCVWECNCPGFVFNPHRSIPKMCKCINSISVEEVESAIYQTILSSKL